MPVVDHRPALVRLLGTQPGLTQREIARHMSISDRTVRRHLTRLHAAGDVVVERDGPAKRYRLHEHARPVEAAPQHFTEVEAEALTVAALAARTTLAPTPFLRPLERAAGKLRTAWVEEVLSFEPESEDELWSFDDASAPTYIDAEIFRTLLVALRNRRPVEVDYFTASTRTASTGRRLHPLGMLVRDGSWLLAAWCCRSDRVKDFALAGFRSARAVEDQHFDPPAGFDLAAHSRDRFRALAGKDVHVVRLEASREAAPYFYRKRYHPTQQIEQELPGGGILVSYEVEGLEDIATFVRSWGAKVRAREPGELADRIKLEARRTLDRYA